VNRKSALCPQNLVAAFVVLVVVALLSMHAPSTVGSTAPTPPPTTGSKAETYCAHVTMQTELDIPQYKRDALLPAYLKCVGSLNATAGTSAKAPPTIHATPVVASGIPRRVAGAGTIVDYGGGRFPSSLVFKNEWNEKLTDRLIRVYALTEMADPQTGLELPRPWQGVLWVDVVTLDESGHLDGGGIYKTPTKAGVIQIVDAVGQRLVVQTDNGTTFYFDIPSRRFVSSLVDGTVTPVPGTPARPTAEPYPPP
jgi:hypothetical protein